jgi:hypothetical protein
VFISVRAAALLITFSSVPTERFKATGCRRFYIISASARAMFREETTLCKFTFD